MADEALNPLRFYGDLAIAAFFAGSNDRQRKIQLDELAEQLSAYLHNPHKIELREPLNEARRTLLEGGNAVHPFHWEIEFPELFDRANPGFDAFVGNPPFIRGKAIGVTFGNSYRDYLVSTNECANASADIVAFFFRRSFSMLRQQGTFGLIATKTISKGDTRLAGLRYICTHDGTIFSARKRLQWPGDAAVIVSTVHVIRGFYDSPI